MDEEGKRASGAQRPPYIPFVLPDWAKACKSNACAELPE